MYRGRAGSDSDDTFTLNYGNLPAASLVVDPATLGVIEFEGVRAKIGFLKKTNKLEKEGKENKWNVGK